MSRQEWLITSCAVLQACAPTTDPSAASGAAASGASTSTSQGLAIECASSWDCDLDFCAVHPERCGPLGNLVDPSCLRRSCVDDTDCASGHVCFHDGFTLTPAGPTLSCDRDFPPGVPPFPGEACYCTVDVRPCAGLCVLAEDAAEATSGTPCENTETSG